MRVGVYSDGHLAQRRDEADKEQGSVTGPNEVGLGRTGRRAPDLGVGAFVDDEAVMVVLESN